MNCPIGLMAVIPDSQSGDESSNLSSGRKKNGKDKRQ